ncbi:MAG: hypothetical protein HY033_06425 [Ignavibacteriae bacterium]|nr:hypothetical protein [Ignavibacteria bacterium]MBI3364527.1 hypothetical protein [Ignavibacteriota bacterium]
MADPRQLRHLLQLLDDDSPVVREMVLRELASFGSTLDRELKQQGVRSSDALRQQIHILLGDRRRNHLTTAWPEWFGVSDDKEKLEAALGLLADFLSERDDTPSVKSLLDKLAQEYESSNDTKNTKSLAHFLFNVKHLRGANEADYYNPQNTNLAYVIRERSGIPISLASIYILVGHRLGLSIEGCNFPGHFLAFASEEGQTFIVDCFKGGRFLKLDDFTRLDRAARVSARDILQLQCNAETIVARVLRNLVNAYQRCGDEGNRKLMSRLLESFESIDDEEE